MPEQAHADAHKEKAVGLRTRADASVPASHVHHTDVCTCAADSECFPCGSRQFRQMSGLKVWGWKSRHAAATTFMPCHKGTWNRGGRVCQIQLRKKMENCGKITKPPEASRSNTSAQGTHRAPTST